MLRMLWCPYLSPDPWLQRDDVITEAGAKSEAAVLMSICRSEIIPLKIRAWSQPITTLHKYTKCMLRIQEYICTVCTVGGSDQRLPLLPAVAYFGSGNSETTLTGATRGLCHAILPLTSAQAMAYK